MEMSEDSSGFEGSKKINKEKHSARTEKKKKADKNNTIIKMCLNLCALLDKIFYIIICLVYIITGYNVGFLKSMLYIVKRIRQYREDANMTPKKIRVFTKEDYVKSRMRQKQDVESERKLEEYLRKKIEELSEIRSKREEEDVESASEEESRGKHKIKESKKTDEVECEGDKKKKKPKVITRPVVIKFALKKLFLATVDGNDIVFYQPIRGKGIDLHYKIIDDNFEDIKKHIIDEEEMSKCGIKIKNFYNGKVVFAITELKLLGVALSISSTIASTVSEILWKGSYDRGILCTSQQLLEKVEFTEVPNCITVITKQEDNIVLYGGIIRKTVTINLKSKKICVALVVKTCDKVRLGNIVLGIDIKKSTETASIKSLSNSLDGVFIGVITSRIYIDNEAGTAFVTVESMSKYSKMINLIETMD